MPFMMMLSVNFSLFSRLLFAPSLESGPGRVQKTLFIARARASSESSRPLHPPTIVNLHPQNSIIGHFMRRSSFNCEEEEGMTKRSKVSMRRLLSWIMFFCAVVGAFAALFFPPFRRKVRHCSSSGFSSFRSLPSKVVAAVRHTKQSYYPLHDSEKE